MLAFLIFVIGGLLVLHHINSLGNRRHLGKRKSRTIIILILTRNEEQEFPSFYCIHSSYKCPCKRLYICKCSNKPLLYHLRSNNGLQTFTVILATPGLCESDVDSALFYSCVRVRTTKIPSTQVISLKPLTYLPFTYLFPTQN